MKKNLLKEKLDKGGVGFGVLISEPAIMIVEILGLLGFDYLYIDCEHSPMSFESVTHLVRAAELRRLTPLVRVPQNVPEIILRYLDTGAMGIIIPNMNSAKMAQKAVRAVKYPPEGERGLSSSVRATDFGLRERLGEHVKTANLETMVLGIIESCEGVECIEDILGTQGIDGVNIGPLDLSKSLGVPGQMKHPLVLEAVDKILVAGEKTGKTIGTTIRAGESPKHYMEKKFRIVTATLNNLVISAGKQFLGDTRT
jgi:4-hydroxy-2-oxoheptanedioate aldolase